VERSNPTATATDSRSAPVKAHQPSSRSMWPATRGGRARTSTREPNHLAYLANGSASNPWVCRASGTSHDWLHARMCRQSLKEMFPKRTQRSSFQPPSEGAQTAMWQSVGRGGTEISTRSKQLSAVAGGGQGTGHGTRAVDFAPTQDHRILVLDAATA
jgi:hypothetical protein